MHWFHTFVKYITRPFILVWIRVRFHGCENLPKKGGYIIACNHNSNMDPILLTWPIRPMVCYMGKEQLFRIPLLGWICRGVGGFPVQRGTGDTSAIDTAKAQVEKGHILGMFPEGTRHPVGEPGRPKSGVALVAKATGADVLPCAIHYTKGLHFRSCASVYYGKLIRNDELFTGEEGPRQIKQATKKFWVATLQLLEEKHGISSDRS